MSAGAPVVRAALVLGGSRGIGLAIAGVLLEEGLAVTIAARHEPDVEAAVAHLRAGAGGREVAAVTADLADTASIEAALAHHRGCFGHLDVLVVAGARSLAGAVADTDRTSLAKVLEINVAGTAEAVRCALPDLRATAGRHGVARVLLLGSIAGRMPTTGFAAYSASKAAVRSLAASVCREERAHGVLATAIAPGYVATAMTAPLESPPAVAMLPAEDVAEAARFVVRLSNRAVVEELVIARVGAESGEP